MGIVTLSIKQGTTANASTHEYEYAPGDQFIIAIAQLFMHSNILLTGHRSKVTVTHQSKTLCTFELDSRNRLNGDAKIYTDTGIKIKSYRIGELRTLTTHEGTVKFQHNRIEIV